MRDQEREGRRRAALRIPQVGPRPAAIPRPARIALAALATLAALTAGAGTPRAAAPADTAPKPAAAPRPAAAAPAAGASKPAAPARPAAGIRKVAFPVKGMVCPLCTRGVEESLKRLPGVGRVTADLASGRVEVEALERHALDIQQVRERTARAGFPANGESDVEARGRFEIGADRRLSFRPAGGAHAWQVLESSRLLALTRAHPGLRGDFLVGFRLHDRPPWKRIAINITSFEAVGR